MSEFKVLVVCIGNMCRSPLAERLLRLRLDDFLGEARDTVHVSSAGVRAVVGAPVDLLAAAELERLGGDATDFWAQQLSPVMLNEADLVLTATRQLRSRVLKEDPSVARRTFPIRKFAAVVGSDVLLDRYAEPPVGPAELVGRAATARMWLRRTHQDIPDPIGRAPAFHHKVAQILDEDCTVIARELAGAVLSGVRH